MKVWLKKWSTQLIYLSLASISCISGVSASSVLLNNSLRDSACLQASCNDCIDSIDLPSEAESYKPIPSHSWFRYMKSCLKNVQKHPWKSLALFLALQGKESSVTMPGAAALTVTHINQNITYLPNNPSVTPVQLLPIGFSETTMSDSFGASLELADVSAGTLFSELGGSSYGGSWSSTEIGMLLLSQLGNLTFTPRVCYDGETQIFVKIYNIANSSDMTHGIIQVSPLISTTTSTLQTTQSQSTSIAHSPGPTGTTPAITPTTLPATTPTTLAPVANTTTLAPTSLPTAYPTPPPTPLPSPAPSYYYTQPSPTANPNKRLLAESPTPNPCAVTMNSSMLKSQSQKLATAVELTTFSVSNQNLNDTNNTTFEAIGGGVAGGLILSGGIIVGVVAYKKGMCGRRKTLSSREDYDHELESHHQDKRPVDTELALGRKVSLGEYHSFGIAQSEGSSFPTMRSHYTGIPTIQENNYNKIVSTLHKGAQEGDCDVLEIFLGFGVPVDLVNDLGNTPLHDAVAAGKLNICKLLLESGADKNLRTKEGKTALQIAREKNVSHVIALLENSSPTSLEYKYIPVKAHYRGLPESELLSRYAGIPPAQVNNYEKIVDTLHKAAQEGDCDVLEIFLGFGVPVDLVNDEGSTPLHDAVAAGQVKVCTFLLERGADKNLRTKEGETALQLAQKHGSAKIVDLLKAGE